MIMNVCNVGHAALLSTAIQDYEAGLLSLAEVQSALQSAIPRSENDGSGVADFVRLAEADLEEIQFTVLLDEQRPAAVLSFREFSALPRFLCNAHHLSRLIEAGNPFVPIENP